MKSAEKKKYENEERRSAIPSTSALDWELFVSGNADALNNLYQSHVDHLFNYGCQLCGNRELVKDSIQDVFHELLRYQHKLKPVSSVKAYLLKSLRRNIIKKLKAQPNNLQIDPKALFSPFDIAISYEANLIHTQGEQDNRKRLRKAIEVLSAKQRQAVMLYFYEGYSYEEIAEIMDMRLVKSARKLVYKAIGAIRKGLLQTHTDHIFLLLIVCARKRFS